MSRRPKWAKSNEAEKCRCHDWRSCQQQVQLSHSCHTAVSPHLQRPQVLEESETVTRDSRIVVVIVVVVVVVVVTMWATKDILVWWLETTQKNRLRCENQWVKFLGSTFSSGREKKRFSSQTRVFFFKAATQLLFYILWVILQSGFG